MATFWEIAAHSVDHMFSLYFGFEGWIWVLIASVPDIPNENEAIHVELIYSQKGHKRWTSSV